MRICSFLFLAWIASGCVHYYPPEVAGQRVSSGGEITQTIIRVRRGVEHTALAPDGPKDYETITCKYYVQEDGKSKREFPIGHSQKKPFLNPFLAVSNSPLWVTYDETIIWTNRPEAAHTVHPQSGLWPSAKPYTSFQVDDLDIYVFDTGGFLRHRTFMTLQKGEGKFVPEEQIYAGEYTFEDGNRAVVFKSPKGLRKYDVLGDTVTDSEPAESEATKTPPNTTLEPTPTAPSD